MAVDEEKLGAVPDRELGQDGAATNASVSSSDRTAHDDDNQPNDVTPLPSNAAALVSEPVPVLDAAVAVAPPAAQAPEEGRTRLQTTLIIAALASGMFLAALDVTIVTVAIPTIAEEFNSPSGYTWIGSAYLLANAAAAPMWGKISDIWGRKPILLMSVAVFWVGSLLSAVSVNMGMLIASRAIQGVGGGGIMILVNICISDLFSMRKRGKFCPPPLNIKLPGGCKRLTTRCRYLLWCYGHGLGRCRRCGTRTRRRLYLQGYLALVLLRQSTHLRRGHGCTRLRSQAAQPKDFDASRAAGY